ncbi:MAG: hypothetical protein IJR40_08210, partial [Treponema sp.]|nr:hypothetical protein [Treponema sp.]
MSAGFYAQTDSFESKPLYSLPKIIEPKRDAAPVVAKKSATIKRVQIEGTKNTLLAAESGLTKINPNGKQSFLWKEGSVQQSL